MLIPLLVSHSTSHLPHPVYQCSVLLALPSKYIQNLIIPTNRSASTLVQATNIFHPCFYFCFIYIYSLQISTGEPPTSQSVLSLCAWSAPMPPHLTQAKSQNPGDPEALCKGAILGRPPLLGPFPRMTPTWSYWSPSSSLKTPEPSVSRPCCSFTWTPSCWSDWVPSFPSLVTCHFSLTSWHKIPISSLPSPSFLP